MTKKMAMTGRRSEGQHRTVSFGRGQQLLLLEQFRGVKNSTEQLETVLYGKEQEK